MSLSATYCSSTGTGALPSTLDEVITKSLDRHAQRQQRRSTLVAGEPRLLTLSEATPDDWRHVVDALAPFMREKRVRTLEHTLSLRRAGLHLVVENVQDPLNAASVVRTAEGLGVQYVHVIESVSEFQLPTSESQASSRGAIGRVGESGAGSGRHVTIERYGSARECVAALRARGLRIFVSDCPTAEEGDDEESDGAGSGRSSAEPPAPPTLRERLQANRQRALEQQAGPEKAAPTKREGMAWVVAKRGDARTAAAIGDLDFAACFEGDGRGAALVFGNERRGCSRALTELSDASFYLPMSGFTQSFNIGVALSMSLAAAIGTGHFQTGGLTEDVRAELLGRWLLRDVKASRSLLALAGIEFEDF